MVAPVTLQSIADRVGVARATVSLALRGKGRMSETTRSEIQAVAAELQYVPNVVARNLRASRSGSIGLYVPEYSLSARYYMEVVYGAVRRAEESDMTITIVPGEVSARSRLEDRLDGVIVVDPDDDDPMVARLLGGHRPVVSSEWTSPRLPRPRATVFTDNRKGIRALLDHLAERGARATLCVLPPETTSWVRELGEGLAEWESESTRQAHVLRLGPRSSPEEINFQIVEILDRIPELNAVVCAAEGAALIAASALRRAGRAVGGDVLLASYVDSDALVYTSPSVTALDLNPRGVGLRCIEAMTAILDDPSLAPFDVEVPFSLHARESTATQVR